jgi:hypothetical protein
MKKKGILIGLLCGAIAFGGCACGRTVDTGTQTVDKEISGKMDMPDTIEDATSEEDTEEKNEEVIIEDNELEFQGDSYITENWQQAYQQKLDELCQERLDSGDELNSENIDTYCLYDLEKDGVPELFVRFGTCEADYHYRVYQCSEDTANQIGEFGGGHTSLYSYPEGSGILLVWGHMGCMSISVLRYENGEFQSEELYSEDINDNPELEYTSVSEIVTGTEYISEYSYNLVLPLFNYTKLCPTTTENTRLSNEQAEAMFLDTIQSNGMVYGVGVDFFEKIGYMEFDTFRQKGNIYEYMEGDSMEVADYTFVDVNGDGQEECWLHLVDGEQSESYVLLSIQNDRVYAYVMNYISYAYMGMESDGTILSGYDGDVTEKLHLYFNKEQCYYESDILD